MSGHACLRRRLLLAAALPAMLGLTACDKPAAVLKFKGVDLTGANYGRDFKLLDPDGQTRTLAGFKGKDLQVILVTVDPERDTPEVLKADTAAFDPTFLGLHADLEGTAATAKEFKAYYKKIGAGTNYTMDHSASLMFSTGQAVCAWPCAMCSPMPNSSRTSAR